MELIKPNWMHGAFIKTLLSSFLKTKDVKVESFEFMAGSKSGENFASNMFKSKISYMINEKIYEISIVIKTVPDKNDNEGKVELIANSPLFKNEMEMYGKVLKDFKKVLDDSGEYQQLWPRSVVIYNLH